MPEQRRQYKPNLKLRQAREARNWTQLEVADALRTTKLVVGRWERGERIPRPFYRARLCELFGKDALELGLQAEQEYLSQDISNAAVPLYWNIPYHRNPFFTGREEIVHTLHELLNQENSIAHTQSWAISGLSGIGKTQIALEYAYQHRQNYHSVFWVNAATRETLLTGLETITKLLQLPEKDEPDQNLVIQAVNQWLISHEKWLLILDNADDIAIVQELIPTEHRGHLLLTTRAQALGSLAQRIEVEVMGMAEGTLLLLRRAKLLDSKEFIDQVEEADLAAAEAIAIEMGFLPLALDQAGAYIDEVGCSLPAYLELYRKHRVELLQRRGYLPTGHPESIVSTWSLIFQHVEQVNPEAANLLHLCAFLDPDAIPEELICGSGASLDPMLHCLTTNIFALNEAIEELRKFSLIQRDSEARLLHIHRMVQVVLRDTMEEGVQRQWIERAVQATNIIFPKTVNFATESLCRRYLPLAQACAMLIQETGLAFEEAAPLLSRIANYLCRHTLYDQAEPLYQQVLRIRKQLPMSASGTR